jgi:hypothetical protein
MITFRFMRILGGRMQRAVRMEPVDWLAFCRALLTEAVIRVSLTTCSAQRVLRWVTTRVERAAGGASMPEQQARRIVWSVKTASRFIPYSTCLTRAFALQLLLARAGAGSTLRVGVTRADDEFAAHAWVERDGVVLIGGGGLHRYTRLPDLGPLVQ